MIKRRHIKLAAGAQAMSSLEIWPAGDYSEYMPEGSQAQRIGQYWSNTGRYLIKAASTIKEDRAHERKREEVDTRE